MTVVATSCLLGVSTRRMEKLVELGITRLSKSQVSEMAKDLDAQLEAFRTRPLDAGPYTFDAADALVQKVRPYSETGMSWVVGIGCAWRRARSSRNSSTSPNSRRRWASAVDATRALRRALIWLWMCQVARSRRGRQRASFSKVSLQGIRLGSARTPRDRDSLGDNTTDWVNSSDVIDPTSRICVLYMSVNRLTARPCGRREHALLTVQVRGLNPAWRPPV